MNQLTVRRTIAAPAEALFDAWLDAESVATWMCPRGFLGTTATLDPKEGGAFEIVMRGPDEVVRHTGTYQVIDRPQRLVFTWMSPKTKLVNSLVTVEFLAKNGATEVVVTHEKLPDNEAVGLHRQGWSEILERLDEERHTLPTK